MLSKITIDVNESGQEQILIREFYSEDLRDRLITRFLDRIDAQAGLAVIIFKSDGSTGRTAVIQSVSPTEIFGDKEKIIEIIANIWTRKGEKMPML